MRSAVHDSRRGDNVFNGDCDCDDVRRRRRRRDWDWGCGQRHFFLKWPRQSGSMLPRPASVARDPHQYPCSTWTHLPLPPLKALHAIVSHPPIAALIPFSIDKFLYPAVATNVYWGPLRRGLAHVHTPSVLACLPDGWSPPAVATPYFTKSRLGSLLLARIRLYEALLKVRPASFAAALALDSLVPLLLRLLSRLSVHAQVQVTGTDAGDTLMDTPVDTDADMGCTDEIGDTCRPSSQWCFPYLGAVAVQSVLGPDGQRYPPLLSAPHDVPSSTFGSACTVLQSYFMKGAPGACASRLVHLSTRALNALVAVRNGAAPERDTVYVPLAHVICLSLYMSVVGNTAWAPPEARAGFGRRLSMWRLVSTSAGQARIGAQLVGSIGGRRSSRLNVLLCHMLVEALHVSLVVEPLLRAGVEPGWSGHARSVLAAFTPAMRRALGDALCGVSHDTPLIVSPVPMSVPLLGPRLRPRRQCPCPSPSPSPVVDRAGTSVRQGMTVFALVCSALRRRASTDAAFAATFVERGVPLNVLVRNTGRRVCCRPTDGPGSALMYTLESAFLCNPGAAAAAAIDCLVPGCDRGLFLTILCHSQSKVSTHGPTSVAALVPALFPWRACADVTLALLQLIMIKQGVDALSFVSLPPDVAAAQAETVKARYDACPVSYCVAYCFACAKLQASLVPRRGMEELLEIHAWAPNAQKRRRLLKSISFSRGSARLKRVTSALCGVCGGYGRECAVCEGRGYVFYCGAHTDAYDASLACLPHAPPPGSRESTRNDSALSLHGASLPYNRCGSQLHLINLKGVLLVLGGHTVVGLCPRAGCGSTAELCIKNLIGTGYLCTACFADVTQTPDVLSPARSRASEIQCGVCGVYVPPMRATAVTLETAQHTLRRVWVCDSHHTRGEFDETLLPMTEATFRDALEECEAGRAARGGARKARVRLLTRAQRIALRSESVSASVTGAVTVPSSQWPLEPWLSLPVLRLGGAPRTSHET